MTQRGFLAVASAVAFLSFLPGSALAVHSFGAESTPPVPVLGSVKVTISTTGATEYLMDGTASGLSFKSTAGWDPKTQQTKETLTDGNGNIIKSSATCMVDPWLTGNGCIDGLVSARGYEPDVVVRLAGFRAPVSAFLLTPSDRERIKAAYQRVMAARKMLGSTVRASSSNLRFAAPTPTHSALASAAGMKRSGGVDVSSIPVATPKPKRPEYGATYAPRTPPPLRVGQTIMLPVLVGNTSVQTWPAGGPFRLSYHWVANGQVTDGAKTLLSSAVAPGGSLNVSATLHAPSKKGTWTLRWDMYQEGVGWFSAKGVPVKEEAVQILP
ncbi:MAG: hypothetical protein WCC53_03775 [Thermoanaerobaculia bacterium]